MLKVQTKDQSKGLRCIKHIQSCFSVKQTWIKCFHWGSKLNWWFRDLATSLYSKGHLHDMQSRRNIILHGQLHLLKFDRMCHDPCSQPPADWNKAYFVSDQLLCSSFFSFHSNSSPHIVLFALSVFLLQSYPISVASSSQMHKCPQITTISCSVTKGIFYADELHGYSNKLLY